MDEGLFRTMNPWLAGASRPLWYVADYSWWPLLIAGGIVAFALFWDKHWRMVAVSFLAIAITDPLCSYGLKPLFGRDRPCQVLKDVYTIREGTEVGGCGSGPSFPSNHAANTAALAMVLGSPPLAVLSLVAGTSRVVLGQHYPSDVLVGWMIGAGIGFGIRRKTKKAFGWT